MANQLGNLIKISTTIVSVILTTIAPIKIVNKNVLALPPETVSKIVRKSTVRIDGEENGSGVIFGKDGNSYIVLTNWHVVDTLGEYSISTADGESHPVKNTVRLKGVDLALVYFESDNDYPVVKKGNSDSLIEGQMIHIAGYPSLQINNNRTYRFTSDSLFGFLDTSDIVEGYELIYDGEATPGLSGSPIFNKEAQLIGIYGLSKSQKVGDIEEAQVVSTYLHGIPINTALKLTTRAGINISESEQISSIDKTPVNPLPTTGDNLNAGFEIQGSSTLNNFVIPEIVYTGECPGKKVENQKAMFFSNTTTTASDRRVIITNITRGLDRDPLPYTDREYQREQVSEETKVTLGVEHDKKNLVVLLGENQFKYEIVQVEEDKDFETVLEEGTFSASVEKTETFVERNKEPTEENYCPGDKATCDYDEQLVRVVDKCPGESSGSFLDNLFN